MLPAGGPARASHAAPGAVRVAPGAGPRRRLGGPQRDGGVPDCSAPARPAAGRIRPDPTVPSLALWSCCRGWSSFWSWCY